MALFTALAVTAAVAGGGAYISNKKKRAASDARNTANAAKEAQAKLAVTPAAGSPAGGTPGGQKTQRAGAPSSKTNYTGGLGLSSGARSGSTLKTLLGE